MPGNLGQYRSIFCPSLYSMCFLPCLAQLRFRFAFSEGWGLGRPSRALWALLDLRLVGKLGKGHDAETRVITAHAYWAAYWAFTPDAILGAFQEPYLFMIQKPQSYK